MRKPRYLAEYRRVPNGWPKHHRHYHRIYITPPMKSNEVWDWLYRNFSFDAMFSYVILQNIPMRVDSSRVVKI
jgi:hypothetical protein